VLVTLAVSPLEQATASPKLKNAVIKTISFVIRFSSKLVCAGKESLAIEAVNGNRQLYLMNR
jgi:hypothetical protein